MKYITPEDYATANKNGIDKKNVDQRVRDGNWSVKRAITESINADMMSVEEQFFGG